MTKLKVFIDFEAISQPFARYIKIRNDFPYAYSFGIHKGNKFKTETTVIDFNKIPLESINEFIRKDITKKIKILLDDKSFLVNSSTIEFVAWAPNLEKKILYRVFKGVNIVDQIKGKSFSLSALTKEEFIKNTYFISLKKEVDKKIEKDFIQKRGLHQDGALAALAGYLLYSDSQNKENKYNIDINARNLVKEIVSYSIDDIKRMSFLYKHSNVFFERITKLEKVNKEKQIISKKLFKLRIVNSFLEKQDKEETIKDLNDKLDKEIQKLEKEKLDLKLNGLSFDEI